jgi:hypothetical protein
VDLSKPANVEVLVRGHLKRVEERRQRWQWYRAAHDDRMWEPGTSNKWTDAFPTMGEVEVLPIKVQVNLVKPFVQRRKSVLFFRNPRSEVVLPAVMSARSRRKVPTERHDAVRAVVDDLLRRADVQAATLHAMGLGLMYEQAAFKTTFDASKTKASPIGKVSVEALPCWEVMWDERAKTARDQRYRGHIRFMTVEQARAVFGTDFEERLKDDSVWLRALPDVVKFGHDREASDDHQDRDASYVHVLELYDFVGKRLRWFLVGETTSGHGATIEAGPDFPMPYTWADGTPACPIEPVILEHAPEHPFEGIAPVAGVFEKAAERSLLLTIFANAARRDASRPMLYLKEKGLTDEVIKRIMSAVDLEFVGVDGPTLNDLFKALESPDTAKSLDKYHELLGLAKSDETVSSDLAEGKQGKYLSATESQILAAGDEQAATEPQARMSAALARVCELALRIVATERTGGGLKVRVSDDVVTLERADLAEAWTVSVVDAASSPMQRAQKIAQFTELQPTLLELVRIASPDPQPAGPDGMPAPPIPEGVRKMALAQLEYLVNVADLPESFKPGALFTGGKKGPTEPDMAEPFLEPEMPAPPAAAAPVVGPAPVAAPPPAVSDQQAAEMLAALSPEQQAQILAMAQQGGV